MSKEIEYVVGQRWFNHADVELGLGLISNISGRCLSVIFPAIEDIRTYAIDKAPLSRISYGVGDEIKTLDELELTVTDVIEESGLLLYVGVDEEGKSHQIFESKLHAVVNFTAPLKRLLAGQVDRSRDYQLKIETLHLNARLYQLNSRGLIGARTEHIEHQLYIASQVAKRFAPRVLLADEVGLGKTIEAGLIVHHQLVTGRANRVLIIVPETLTHQWFVEMLRRFNLPFSIFNQERYQAIDDDNPFETEQLILTSIDFLTENVQAAQQAQNAKWDIVVVDEAHHLQWSEKDPSPEYTCVEQFSKSCKGLILLTATPEQLGAQSHFARLRLLDSARFNCFETFKKEEENFVQINELAQALILYAENNQTDLLSEDLKDKVKDILGENCSSSISKVTKMLLDRHGTGRVLFRNTRSAIPGFTQRFVHCYELERPDCYEILSEEPLESSLHPESLFPDSIWLNEDPRVTWLVEKIRALRPNKVLVITAHASTAIALEKHLRLNTNIRAADFHEGLSIVERDQASAYFSDFEVGAECLICSEIGSEGRNFQFAHELILFDLPLIPDLLEQRIGRLDRISQNDDINIHVPVIKNTPMAALFNWYHEGLNLFQKSCSFGFEIFQMFEESLIELLTRSSIPKRQLQLLIEETQNAAQEMQERAESGRDKLLELSSCNREKARVLIDEIEREEDPAYLQDYMNKVFNAYGVSHEVHSEHTDVLMPTDHMRSAYFPGLNAQGNTVTYSREKALIREDIEFLSVEHPMVRECMEMIIEDDAGSAILNTISVPGLAQGTLLLEAFYTTRTLAPAELNVNRFLPLTPIRVLMSLDNKNLEHVISHEQLSGLCKKVKRQLTGPIINQIKPHIETLGDFAKLEAVKQLPKIQETAQQKLSIELDDEQQRLVELKKINKNIRDEEVLFIQNKKGKIQKIINETSLKLEAIRLVINN